MVIRDEKSGAADRSPRGFGGLSSLVSNVDTDFQKVVPIASTPSARETSASANGSADQAPSQATDSIASPQQVIKDPNEFSARAKALILCGAGAAVVLVLVMANELSHTQVSPVTQPPQQAQTPRQQQPTQAPVPPRQTMQQAPTAVPAPSRPSELKPPISTGAALNTSQIRYCLAEKIRLDAGEDAVDKYSQEEIDRFNALVNDYNGRCASFKYFKKDLDAAKADIEPYRFTIQTEGRRRFSR